MTQEYPIRPPLSYAAHKQSALFSTALSQQIHTKIAYVAPQASSYPMPPKKQKKSAVTVAQMAADPITALASQHWAAGGVRSAHFSS
jgi:hypothetical protein